MNSTSAPQLDSYNLLIESASQIDKCASLQLDTDISFNKEKRESPMVDQSLVNVSQPPPLKNSIGHSTLSNTPGLDNQDDTISHDIQQFQLPQKKTELESVELTTQPLQKMQDTKPNEEEAIALAPGSSKSNQIEKTESLLLSSQDRSKVSAYARLEFENFIFFVQTLQVVLGRKSENDQSHTVDVHLGPSKAISRKHAKIFYNFGTERFELSIQGKNGAFVDDGFIERGATVPLINNSKIQIGQIVFRFVLPGMNPEEGLESPSKPINPSDAISLRSTLYTNHSNVGLEESSSGNAHSLTSKDFQPVNSNNSGLPAEAQDPKSTTDEAVLSPSNEQNNVIKSTLIGQPTGVVIAPAVKKPREKKPPKPPKPPKKVYTLEEIPEEYRAKPACSYSNLIATCLRTHGTPKGMSLAEIYKSIREIFPYYKYCPDGWQSSVRHNLSLNKAFRKVSKEGKGWLWGLDEEYCAEKERQKKKQQEAAAAKAKAAQLKLEQQQQQQQKLQQQRLEQQKQLQMAQAAQQQFQQQQQSLQTIGNVVQHFPGSNQNTIALNNIGLQNIQTPIPNSIVSASGTLNTIADQVKPQAQLPHISRKVDPSQIPKFTSTQPQPQLQPSSSQNSVFQINMSANLQSKTPNIQAQLAANRGVQTTITPQSVKALPTPLAQNSKPDMNANTKKVLAHLQQQLVTLSKDLRNLVDKPTISQILTQAIAMTIAQVTQAAKNKGITTDPLATLIDTNPSQLTKILTVALNAATYKVTNGRIKAPLSLPPTIINSVSNSKASTPGSSLQEKTASNTPTPILQTPQLAQPTPATPRIQSPILASVVKAQPQIFVENVAKSSQQLQKAQIPLQKVTSELNSIPSPVQTNQPVPKTLLPQSHNQQQKIVQTQGTPQIQQQTQKQTPQPPTTLVSTVSQASNQFINHTATTTPQPQVQLAQPTPPQIALPAPPQIVPPVQPNHSQINPTAQAVLSQSQYPVNPVIIPIQDQATQPQKIQLSEQVSAPASETFTSVLQSAPILRRVNTVVPAVETKQVILPKPQSIQSSPVNLSASLANAGGASLKIKFNETSTPFSNLNASDSPNFTSSVANLSAIQSSPQKTPDSVQPEIRFDLDTVNVNLQGSSETKQQSKAEELNFDDLNDPEFDKVLGSLSKEGTPTIEGDDKGMNDEELSRILSENFTTSSKPAPDIQSSKRTFDEVDTSQIQNDVSNKLSKTN